MNSSRTRRSCGKTAARILLAALVLFACAGSPGRLHAAGLEDLFKDVQRNIFNGGNQLSENKIIDGLKEALVVGTEKAISLVSEINGYYGNADIRIPLPKTIRNAESLIRAVGYGKQLDEFELSMNRAAERAAPEAKTLLWEAIRKLTIQDARTILNGRDNEATLYFREKTEDRLAGIFNPIVHDAMSETGVTRSYQDVTEALSAVPFAKIVDFDLDRYVTALALDGLFFMLAEQERKIREDPAARVTDLLKEVFQ